MENFRDFMVGPDPFGRTWHAYFKYLQTGISIRHSDSVDVRFILESDEERTGKTIVIQHADLRAWSEKTGGKISDTLCSRVAALRLKRAVETAEDLDKDYLPLTASEIAAYSADIQKWEAEWVKSHAA